MALWFLAGVLAARAVPRSRVAVPVLHGWVVNVALPALVLVKVPGLAWGSSAVVPVAVAWSTVAAGAVTVVFLSRRLAWSPTVTGSMMLLVPLGNTSFLGLPVVENLLGADRVPAALAFDQLGTFLALATYGAWVTARAGTGTVDAVAVMRRVLAFPPFVALIASVALRRWHLPVAVDDLLGSLGRTVAPVAMLATGLRLATGSVRGHAATVAVGLGVKMVLLPGLVALAAVLVGDLSSPVWQAALLESAMPPMVTAGVVAARAGFDEDVASSMVAAGTVLALAAATVASFVT